MQGDFSRQTFNPKKHYRKVNTQMGRVSADADPNEQRSIDEFVLDTETQDIIGACGAPKPANGGGFAIGVSGDGTDLTISPGRIYVDGILCINEADATSTLRSQPDLPLAANGLAGFTMPDATGIYLAYLDVWQRHITSIEDAEIREVALGGPDTCTRAKTVWQVKLVRVAEQGAAIDCDTLPANWQPAVPDGELAAQTAPPPATSGPCVLPPTAGYRRLENQLYRVEVHTGGPLAGATFKWSRDNGSVTTPIVAAPNGQTLTVQTTGRDDVLGFGPDQWVELLDDRMELTDQRGQLLQIDSVNPATREITIKAVTPIPAFDGSAHPKLRRWDQSGAGTSSAGVAMAGTWLPIEDGLQVEFADGKTYRSGDWWWIPARTAINGGTGNLEWPVDGTGQPLVQLPNGIQHHYCDLGLVTFNGAVFENPVTDCRHLFPPLTDISASDVSFDDSTCSLPGVTNVQQAIDALCQGSRGMCTLVVAPGENWEATLGQIQQGQDAEICFQVGDYKLDKTIVLQDTGNLTLHGCGRGTRITGPSLESAFHFQGCPSVVLSDLSVQTGTVGAAGEAKHLNGVLAFRDCPAVEVRDVTVQCPAGASRMAACISVENSPPSRAGLVIDALVGAPAPTSARVRHCDLTIGHEQVGILLVNVRRAQVEDNQMHVAPRPQALDLSHLLQDSVFRAGVRRLLVSNNFIGQGAPKGHTPPFNATLALNAQTLRLRTDPSLARPWQDVISSLAPPTVQSPLALSSFVKNTADRLLLDPAFRQTAPAFGAWFENLNRSLPSVASQGIVVAGSLADDVRILNNTIMGVMQGVHVGLSHREARGGPHDQSGPIHVSGNTIGVTFFPTATRQRHGIFVGNSLSTIIDNNNVAVSQPVKTQTRPIEGVRVWGTLGRMMIVRHNSVRGASTGIRVQPNNPPVAHQKNQWLVADNIAEGAQNAIVVPGDGSVASSNNLG